MVDLDSKGSFCHFSKKKRGSAVGIPSGGVCRQKKRVAPLTTPSSDMPSPATSSPLPREEGTDTVAAIVATTPFGLARHHRSSVVATNEQHGRGPPFLLLPLIDRGGGRSRTRHSPRLAMESHAERQRPRRLRHLPRGDGQRHHLERRLVLHRPVEHVRQVI